MKELPIDLIDTLFKDNEIFDTFVRAINMSTKGNIENKLETIFPNIIKILHEELL